MKPILISRVALFAVALLVTTTLLPAQTVRYGASALGSKVRVEGTSSVHAWAVEGTLVGGFMELPADFPLDASKPLPATLPGQPKVEINIPVGTLSNDKKSAPMDERMGQELKSGEHKQIRYRLTEMKPGKTEAGKLNFDTKGDLVVAGVTNNIAMPVAFEKLADNKLKVTGAIAMKMSDFKIKAPEFSIAGLALMKTGDEIKVSFEWMTVLKPAAQPK